MKNIENQVSTEEKKSNDIWIISCGTTINLDPSSISDEPVSGPVTEYKISEIGRYLLDPNPISLEEKVVGCKVEYRRKSGGRLRRLIHRLFSGKDKSPADSKPEVEEIISSSRTGSPDFEDEHLNAHLMKISAMLRPFDPVKKRLSKLDKDRISDITAICEEIGRNRYPLNLQGSIEEKINFVSNSLSRKAKVLFNKAYMLNGLFELRGFKFDTFNPETFYRLIRFTQNNMPGYYVVDADFKFKFRIYDNALVNYMHILEQTISSDPKLREALLLCIRNNAKPLKLFFSNKLEHPYSGIYLPMTYREVFNSINVSRNEKETITKALNDRQNIVFFNYVPWINDGQQKIFTNISVMHDLKALETIKSQLPHVYSEINKKARVSDAGSLYLLDSIREKQNV